MYEVSQLWFLLPLALRIRLSRLWEKITMEDIRLFELINEYEDDAPTIAIDRERTIVIWRQEVVSAGRNGCIERRLYGYQEFTTARSVLERAGVNKACHCKPARSG